MSGHGQNIVIFFVKMHHEWPQGSLLPSGSHERRLCCPDGISIPVFWSPATLAPYIALTLLWGPFSPLSGLLQQWPHLLAPVFCTNCSFITAAKYWTGATYRLKPGATINVAFCTLLKVVGSFWHSPHLQATSWKTRRQMTGIEERLG